MQPSTRHKPLTQRLNFFGELDPHDLNWVDGTQAKLPPFGAGEVIGLDVLRAHPRLAVAEGWVACVRCFADGRRQVLALILPGETIGGWASFDGARVELECISRVQLVDTARLCDHVVHCEAGDPVAAAFGLTEAFNEAVGWNGLDRLTRQSGFERVGHLLLDVSVRLHASGAPSPRSFACPLTLSTMASALGLSPVQTSRIVTNLRQSGLVYKDRRLIVLSDWQTLAARVHYRAPGLWQVRQSAFADAPARANTAQSGAGSQI